MDEPIDQKKSNKALWITGLIIAIFVIGLLTNGFGLFNSSPNIKEPIPLAIENSPVLGDPNAPVTIYEFSDFSCQFCGQFAKGALPLIKQNYVETGKAKIVFKYFPGHGTARPAHAVGLALNEQGLFWEFHDLAFDNPDDLGSLNKMKALAETLGADMDQLDSDLDATNYYNQLQRETNMGSANGVEGTPFFLINGRSISGAQPYSVFESTIENALN
ncbi:hypothetical protein CMI47_11375 [Candidatus Pacearchaeota archaeon]|nr:hypothetical protein [Candidatus Pacearchaeota archaeon]|tara:strand:- start:19 stop:669 length:651 start_codon:yes stop_codon:yes gene_type:complete